MIKNERQYRITKAQAEKFRRAIQEFMRTPPRTVHPMLRKAQLRTLKSQVVDLQRELKEYETCSPRACTLARRTLLKVMPGRFHRMTERTNE